MAKNTAKIAGIVLLILLVIAGGFMVSLFALPQKIKVSPSVFDIGNENYCIIFTTSLKGSGYVKYTLGGKEKIVFSHEPRLTDHFGVNREAPLAAPGFDLITGGHLHRSEFIEGSVPSFVACGKYKDGWVASSLTLENGTIRMLTINTEGEIVLDKTITVTEE